MLGQASTTVAVYSISDPDEGQRHTGMRILNHVLLSNWLPIIQNPVIISLFA